MEILTKLTPAEVCLIRNRNYASYKELLRLTMADLTLKRVIRKITVSGDNSETQYVSPGENFSVYQAKSHEAIFLSPFKKDQELEIRLDHYIKLIVQKAQNKRVYIFARLLRATGFGTNVKQGLFNKLFCTIRLTDSGKQLRAELMKVFSILEKQLPELIQNDKESALVILDAIYGNVFLVNGLDHGLLTDIDKALESNLIKRNKPNKPTKSSGGGFGCAGYFGGYDDTGSSFDHAFDSVTDSGGSGCGGGAGCSGCGGGGCGGGCGGCGG